MVTYKAISRLILNISTDRLSHKYKQTTERLYTNALCLTNINFNYSCYSWKISKIMHFFKSRLKYDTGNGKRKMVILVVFFGKSYVTL